MTKVYPLMLCTATLMLTLRGKALRKLSFSNEFMCGEGDVRRREAEVLKEFARLAGFAEVVLHADTLHRRRKFLTEKFGNGATKAADHLAFLSRNDLAGFADAGQNGFVVQWFDRGNIDDFGRNAVLSQDFRSDSSCETNVPQAKIVTSVPSRNT